MQIKLDNSFETIKELSIKKSHEIYGEILPEVAESRLNTELDMIKKNNSADMFVIYSDLVSVSEKCGYKTFPRANTAASFVAYLTGISNLNPLPPHYRCSKKHYVDFDSEKVTRCALLTGAELFPRKCPVCGEPLIRDGYNLPYEALFGLNGEKQISIDINFAPAVKTAIIQYLKELPGFTVARYTVEDGVHPIAYALFPMDKNNDANKNADTNANKNADTNADTNANKNADINTYKEADIEKLTERQFGEYGELVTKENYFDICDKYITVRIYENQALDLLHDLKGNLNVEPSDMPMDQEEVRDLKKILFGLTSFKSKLAEELILTFDPDTFFEVMQIIGHLHNTGTDISVLLANAGFFGFNVATREEIFLYLQSKGVDRQNAYDIMEWAGTGKAKRFGLKDGMADVMTKVGVSKEYIDYLSDIKYMFSKAHCTSYAWIELQLAWYKVNYPDIYKFFYSHVYEDYGDE